MFFGALVAIFMMFLALSDIAYRESEASTGWYVTGIRMMATAACIVSAMVTLALLYRYMASERQWQHIRPFR